MLDVLDVLDGKAVPSSTWSTLSTSSTCGRLLRRYDQLHHIAVADEDLLADRGSAAADWVGLKAEHARPVDENARNREQLRAEGIDEAKAPPAWWKNWLGWM